MARYRSDYSDDFGRWRDTGPFSGGMRSDGWGGTADWKRFAGEEGWYGEGYDGMPGIGYDSIYGSGGGPNRYGPRSSFPSRYEDERARDRGIGGRWDQGYGRRDFGYAQGWEDRVGPGQPRWGRIDGAFGSRSIRAMDIMTENPQAVTPETPVAEVARKMRDLDVGIIPVIDNRENRQLRGVITDRDITIRAVAEDKAGEMRVDDCMTSHVRAVNKNDSIRDVMRVMRQDLVRRVPVTDREGRLVGIIAQADLAVDYAARDADRESELAETLERISEPAQPRR